MPYIRKTLLKTIIEKTNKIGIIHVNNQKCSTRKYYNSGFSKIPQTKAKELNNLKPIQSSFIII